MFETGNPIVTTVVALDPDENRFLYLFEGEMTDDELTEWADDGDIEIETVQAIKFHQAYPYAGA